MAERRNGIPYLVALLACALTLALGFWLGRRPHAPTAPAQTGAAKQLWTCGMHPQVIQDHPGTCPICQMDLTPLTSGAEEHEHGVRIDPTVVQNMGVRVEVAARERLVRSVRAAGWHTEACDGHEAVEMIQSRRPDLVLFDLALAQLNGLGLMAAVAQLPPSDRPAAITIAEPNDKDANAIKALYGIPVLTRGSVSPPELRVMVGFEIDRRSLKAAG